MLDWPTLFKNFLSTKVLVGWVFSSKSIGHFLIIHHWGYRLLFTETRKAMARLLDNIVLSHRRRKTKTKTKTKDKRFKALNLTSF